MSDAVRVEEFLDMSKSLDKLLKSIERGDRLLKKLQQLMPDDQQQTVNNLLGVNLMLREMMVDDQQQAVNKNVNCPKCGAFVDERDGGCLACDFLDRLAAQDKMRG